ncbi:carboxylesterase/lipase family protein [Amycolatopsis pigmentata]|uniref:Carboxylic ester hydrolase n=1 Tax=Amycolatopsis pigmentata TaxID=450801 RepID=A0ABW5FQ13_9PSEU
MNTELQLASGTIRGERGADGLTVFRGVPYAHAARFTPPKPVEPWTGVFDATRPGPISPQPPVRPDAVMGPPQAGLRQDEDCLNLTVVTPGVNGPRPVMVWIHGGAYVTGASSFGFYEGRRLAAEGGIVFVAINYRLGALGYLKLPGVAPGNLGLLDQVAALRWIRENIGNFGGDPDRVTVFGQSAGAHSVACLMAAPAARGLFRQAILQSAPLGLKLATPARAARVARHFTTALRAEVTTAPVEAILAAQDAAIQRVSGPGGLASPPFCPTAGTDALPGADRWTAEAAGAGVDVMIGTTSAEMNGFLNGKPFSERIERVPLVGRRGLETVKRLATRRVFETPSLRFADTLARAGRRVFTYRFGWAASGSIFGACHCVELPFLLGEREAWAGAPMLAGADWDDIEEIGRPLRQAWISFARGGSPGSAAHVPGSGPGRIWTGPVPSPDSPAEVM